jgi:hypothetical protein
MAEGSSASQESSPTCIYQYRPAIQIVALSYLITFHEVILYKRTKAPICGAFVVTIKR